MKRKVCCSSGQRWRGKPRTVMAAIAKLCTPVGLPSRVYDVWGDCSHGLTLLDGPWCFVCSWR